MSRQARLVGNLLKTVGVEGGGGGRGEGSSTQGLGCPVSSSSWKVKALPRGRHLGGHRKGE